MSKVLVITGGSRGIGRATALGAAAAGFDVALNYRSDKAAADATVAAIEALGRRAFAKAGDIASEADVLALFDEATATLGPITAVVNNAGIVAPSASVIEFTVERLERLFAVNILGAFLVAREAARRLTTGGVLVNVSSIAARLGSPHEYVDYAASKAAVDTLTIGLAKELAPRGIRVNCVRPGLTDTDIHASGGDPDRAARLGATTPLGRPGKAEEIASGILYMLSDSASYITGSLLDVGGGR